MLPGGGGLEEPPDSDSGGFVTTPLQRSGDVDDASAPKTSIVPNAWPWTISLTVLPKQGFLLQLWVTGFVFGTWSNPCSAGIDTCINPRGIWARNDDDETWWSAQSGQNCGWH